MMMAGSLAEDLRLSEQLLAIDGDVSKFTYCHYHSALLYTAQKQ